jgi:outer membrane protein TolC
LRSNEWKKRGAGALALASLLSLSPAGMVRAQGVTVETKAVPAPAEAAQLETRDGAVVLSIEQAVAIALRQNLGLVIERYTRAQSRLGIMQSMGIYDLLATADALYTDDNAATASDLEASELNRQSLNFSLTQRLPTGGDLSVGVDNSRLETNSQFAQVNPSYNSGLSFSFTQPLLRNFGRFLNERGILVARVNSGISRQEFERQVTSTIQQVVNAYWDLVNAREQLVVAEESLALARELHERNRIQVEVGTLAPLEMVQSEATIATRDEDIIRSRASVGDAEDQLRRLLNLPAGAVWEQEILPATDPKIDRVEVNVEQAIQTAYVERPELRGQELAIERARIDAEFFRNQLKPRLDLAVDYGYSGVGGRFGDALEQITGIDFLGWTARLNFAYPIQNRAARAQSAIANLDVDSARTTFEEQRTVVATEVRRAVRGVTTAAQQIEASRISREFQEKNLDAERKRYENGMSTSFQITQIQEELTRARSREVTAIVTYRTALAEYYRATGLLLRQEGVTIDDPTTPVEEGLIDWWSFDKRLGEE